MSNTQYYEGLISLGYSESVAYSMLLKDIEFTDNLEAKPTLSLSDLEMKQKQIDLILASLDEE